MLEALAGLQTSVVGEELPEDVFHGLQSSSEVNPQILSQDPDVKNNHFCISKQYSVEYILSWKGRARCIL